MDYGKEQLTPSDKLILKAGHARRFMAQGMMTRDEAKRYIEKELATVNQLNRETAKRNRVRYTDVTPSEIFLS